MPAHTAALPEIAERGYAHPESLVTTDWVADHTGDTQVIAYCRIGERSSHTWFVLKYLLGFRDVKNYDGSWTEWGNLVGVPIER
jgi:3-mercaptopyruvate sulfurtransferase SseA